ncbi:MAG: 3-phosphoshikimate 1-carboxyvinyltransferase [Acidobacteria bacterium]|nr:3-phosphoshikimate 1-carboxyvinyltransferase [Acidobacteriota bacterium]
MTRNIKPATAIQGRISLPGDKSISHRYGMLAGLTEGISTIRNYSTGADCASTLACMRALGVPIARDGNLVVIDGVGLTGLRPPSRPLDAGNSGSTIRMLSGILAGQSFTSEIGGDKSLSQRPMKRIMTPLEQMGARIEARDGNFPPLKIHGGELRPIHYELPVASAQVKTAVLFAGLFASGWTVVREPLPTRDHSEIALGEFGAYVEVEGTEIRIEGGPTLQGQELTVPGDISSAAFFIAAALLLTGSELVIEGLGLNPSRASILDLLRGMGADIEILDRREDHGETVGDILIHGPESAEHPSLQGGVIEGAMTAAVIDEIPILAVLGAASADGLIIRDAAELRVKETDRIATVADNLSRMGVEVEVEPDGLRIPGRQSFRPAQLDSFGDHRIAMAFAVAGLCAAGESELNNAEAAAVSFPEFYDLLEEITRS